MSNLTRWEPVREMLSLREAMNKLFDDSFTLPMICTKRTIRWWSRLPCPV